MIQGTIGEGASIEFSAYLRTSRELPTIEAILAAQTKAEVPVAGATVRTWWPSLAQYTRERKKSAMKYVARMPAEFALLYILDVRRDDLYNIRKDEEIGKWITAHEKLFQTAVAA